MKQEYLYVLCGDNGKPFYLGHSVNPAKRFEQHLEESQGGGNSLKCRHIRALLAEGQTIKQKIVDQCDADKLDDLEAWWIDQLSFEYFLYNGNGGVRGKAINEAALKRQIADHKKASKARVDTLDPNSVRKKLGQAAFDAQVKFYMDNPNAFEAERLRRDEVAKADAKWRKQKS